jgi:hypothetical protein
MEAFAKQYGFQFRCHEKGHSDRKAGEERSFWTVETNFLTGRSFLNFNDLNRQAFEWATVRMEHRPQGKAKLIPAKAFEHERHYLAQLPAHLPAPYQVHERGTDQETICAAICRWPTGNNWQRTPRFSWTYAMRMNLKPDTYPALSIFRSTKFAIGLTNCPGIVKSGCTAALVSALITPHASSCRTVSA